MEVDTKTFAFQLSNDSFTVNIKFFHFKLVIHLQLSLHCRTWFGLLAKKSWLLCKQWSLPKSLKIINGIKCHRIVIKCEFYCKFNHLESWFLIVVLFYIFLSGLLWARENTCLLSSSQYSCALQVVIDHGFDVLDLHYAFRRQTDQRAADGIHWNQRIHRIITLMLISHICDSWKVALPFSTVSNSYQSSWMQRQTGTNGSSNSLLGEYCAGSNIGFGSPVNCRGNNMHSGSLLGEYSGNGNSIDSGNTAFKNQLKAKRSFGQPLSNIGFGSPVNSRGKNMRSGSQSSFGRSYGYAGSKVGFGCYGGNKDFNNNRNASFTNRHSPWNGRARRQFPYKRA